MSKKIHKEDNNNLSLKEEEIDPHKNIDNETKITNSNISNNNKRLSFFPPINSQGMIKMNNIEILMNNESSHSNEITKDKVLSLIPNEREEEFLNIFNNACIIFSSLDLDKELDPKSKLILEYLISLISFSISIKKNYTSEYLKLLSAKTSKLEYYLLKLKDLVQEILKPSFNSLNLVNYQSNIKNKENFDDGFSIKTDFNEIELHLKKDIVSFTRSYEMQNEIFAKFELLFNIFFEVKSKKSELVRKILWLIFITVKSKVLGSQSSIYEKLLLMTSVFLSFMNYFIYEKKGDDEEPKNQQQDKSNIFNQYQVKDDIIFTNSKEEDLNLYAKNKKLIFTFLHLPENSINEEKIIGLKLMIRKEFNKMNLFNDIETIIRECCYHKNDTNDIKIIEEEELMLENNQKRIEIKSEKIINTLSNEYEFSLNPSEFNACLFLNLSAKSDRSPVKTAVFSIKNTNNINQLIINNFNNNVMNNNNNNNNNGDPILLNPNHFTAFRRLNFQVQSNEANNQKLDSSSTNITTPKSLLSQYNNEANFFPLNTFNNLSSSNPGMQNLNLNLISASPIGVMTSGNSYQMLTPITRVVTINKWLIDYISSFTQETLINLIMEKYGENKNEEKKIELQKKKIQELYDFIDKRLESYISLVYDSIEKSIFKVEYEKNKKNDIKILCLKLITGLFQKNNYLMDDNLECYFTLLNNSSNNNNIDINCNTTFIGNNNNIIFVDNENCQSILNNNNNNIKASSSNNNIGESDNIIVVGAGGANYRHNKHCLILQSVIKSTEFVKCIVICAFEIILYVDNIQENFFFKNCNKLGLDIYSLLKILNPIMTFDVIYLPNTLRYHFAEIELIIIQFMLYNEKYSKNGLKFFKNFINTCYSSSSNNQSKDFKSSFHSINAEEAKENKELINNSKGSNLNCSDFSDLKTNLFEFSPEENEIIKDNKLQPIQECQLYSKKENSDDKEIEKDINSILSTSIINLNIIEIIESIELKSQSLYMFLTVEHFSLNQQNNEILTTVKELTLRPEKLILSKILNYMLLLNKFITTKMKIEISLANKIESLIKKIILNQYNIDILINRHLDQVVLCSIIAILNYCKMFSTTKSDEIFGKVIEQIPDTHSSIIIKKLSLQEFYYSSFNPTLEKEIDNIINEKRRVSSNTSDSRLYNNLIEEKELKDCKISSKCKSKSSKEQEEGKEKENILLRKIMSKDYSSYHPDFTGYYYFFKTAFEKQLQEINSRSGVGQIRSFSQPQQPQSNRTNSLINLYNFNQNSVGFNKNKNIGNLKENEQNNLNPNKNNNSLNNIYTINSNNENPEQNSNANTYDNAMKYHTPKTPSFYNYRDNFNFSSNQFIDESAGSSIEHTKFNSYLNNLNNFNLDETINEEISGTNINNNVGNKNFISNSNYIAFLSPQTKEKEINKNEKQEVSGEVIDERIKFNSIRKDFTSSFLSEERKSYDNSLKMSLTNKLSSNFKSNKMYRSYSTQEKENDNNNYILNNINPLNLSKNPHFNNFHSGVGYCGSNKVNEPSNIQINYNLFNQKPQDSSVLKQSGFNFVNNISNFNDSKEKLFQGIMSNSTQDIKDSLLSSNKKNNEIIKEINNDKEEFIMEKKENKKSRKESGQILSKIKSKDQQDKKSNTEI